MLENMKSILEKANKERYAIAQININGFEWVKTVLQFAEQTQSPVILGVNHKAAKYLCGYKATYSLVKSLDEELNISVPVVLHADHCDFNGAVEALNAGFTSVMYDGSADSIEENVRKTKMIVTLAKEKNATVEAEVGSPSGEEDGISSVGELANIGDCAKMAETGIDVLAASIGNIHGKYPEGWQGLNMELLKTIHENTSGLPLALHGGSGIPEEMILEAIKNGITKINVNTECKIKFCEAIEHDFSKTKNVDPFHLYQVGMEGIDSVVKEKMELFGSIGKQTKRRNLE